MVPFYWWAQLPQGYRATMRRQFTLYCLPQSWLNFGNMQWALRTRSSHWQMLFKIGVLNHFAIFTEKQLCQSLLLIKLEILRPETPAQVFSFEYWNFKKAFFAEPVWWLLLKNPWHFWFIWKIGYWWTCLLLGFLKLCYRFILAIEIQLLWCCIAIS